MPQRSSFSESESVVSLFWSRYRGLFILGVSFVGVEAFCDLLQPTLLARLIDEGVRQHRLDLVAHQGLFMLLIAGIGAGAALIRNRLASVVSQKFGADLRSGLYRRVQGFTHREYACFEPSTLVTRLTNDVTQIQNFVNGIMRVFAKAPLLGVGALVMASLLNLKLSLIFLVVVPLVALAGWWNASRGFPLFRLVQKGVDRVNSLVREVLRGIRVVKAFDQFATEQKRFAEANNDLSRTSTTAGRVVALFNPLVSLIVNLAVVFLLSWGNALAARGQMEPGTIIAFVNYITQILFALVMTGFVLMVFVRAKASVERVTEILKAPRSGLLVTGTFQAKSLGKLEARELSFRFPEAETWTLRGLSFTIDEGMTVGVLGAMGSGKSTLARLLPRFFDPDEGVLQAGGRPLPDWDLGLWRQQLAWVPEKAVLFGGTIRENLLWGRAEANDQELAQACEIAQAMSFIESFPSGWDTPVGQRGMTLSGGQKQRLTLARALVRRPSLLILDDSFSALDAWTEAQILKAMKALSGQMTIFQVSQKASAVRKADLILVLEQGQLAGAGTHDQLVKACPVYREILSSQGVSYV